MPLIGTFLNNRYRLDRELGRGGMGTVFEGYDTLLNRTVAVKILGSSTLGTEGKNRLLTEARAVAQLNHPNIVAVYDAGETDEMPFVVMEYIHGESLHDQPPHSTQDILRAALQVCDALEEAHNHGIVHRDLKPENVIVTESGLAKLTDFGLARSLATRMSQEGALTGTVFYISPEQALGKPLDGRTDLYSLGVMLYEFATGRLPFMADDPLAVIAQHIHQAPEPPAKLNKDIPASFEAIILKLLSKKADDRYGSAAETRSALEALKEGRVVPGTRKERHNLPLDLTSFIGREKEVSEVKRMLLEHRLVTLTGVGGTGKTRLGLNIARGLIDQFADGVWLVDLSTLREGSQVLRAIAAALEARESADKPLIDALLDVIGDRTMLVILDNCEHLINACADTAGKLLTACPNLKMLATSREALGLPGEVAYHVPSLRLPDILNLPAEPVLWETEAMRLFRDRALAVKPDFNPDAAQAEAVAKICSRLDGIPLAIELAAARVRALPVEEIARRLSDRFRLLSGGSRSALPRQQTLQALIDWSYDLLTDDEKALLRHLSVFIGGCTLEAAESVCCGESIPHDDVLNLITRLVDKSLLLFNESDGDARYEMLETIRQYAREKLIQANEIENARRNHLAYFASRAEAAAPELWHSDQRDWMDRLEHEHDNLRAALDWSLCAECGEGLLEAGMRIAVSIFYFWMARGHWSEGWDWMERLLQAADTLEMHGPLVNRLRYSAGFIIIELGNVHIARELFNRVLNDAHAQQDINAQAYAHLGLAAIATNAHAMTEAETNVEKALPMFRALDDKVGVLLALSVKGGIAADQMGYDKAREHYQENLRICREIGHELGAAGSLVALGRLETYFGDKALGSRYLQEGLAIFRRAGDKSGIASVLTAMGLAELYSEDIEHSRAHYSEALKIARELRSGPAIGTALIALGEISRGQGNYDSAREYYEEALHINERLGQMGIVSIVAHNLGYVARRQGEFDRALGFFRQSLRLSRQREQRRFIYFCLCGIAGVMADLGRTEDAARLFGFAEAMGAQSHFDLDPVDRWEVRQSQNTLARALPEAKVAALKDEGKCLTLEEAIDLAFKE